MAEYGILVNGEKEFAINTYNNIGEPQWHTTECKKPDSNQIIQHGSTYAKFENRGH